MANWQSQIASIGGGVVSFLLWTIIVVLIGLLIWSIVRYVNYNWRVTLRYRTHAYDYVVPTRGRLVRGRNKITRFVALKGGFITMFQSKVTAPSPPPEAISLTLKGKRIVELEVDGVGDTRYIVKHKTKEVFEPVDTDDREFYVNEIRDAEERRKLTWQQVIVTLAPLFVLVIIFAMALIFWEDVTAPSINMANKLSAMIDKADDITQKQREILLLQYRLLGEEVPEDAPPE